jgi:hypothetical protein
MKHIYWDDGFGNILDVNALWWEIASLFKKKFSACKFYVETMVMLMISCGTDFNDHYNSLGPKTIWNYFADKGYDIMFGDGGMLIDFKNDSFLLGDCVKRTSIQITESKMIRFIEGFLLKKMNRKQYVPSYRKRKQTQLDIGDENDVAMRESDKYEKAELSDIKEKNNGLIPGKYTVPTKKEIVAWCRRNWWVMDYWMNGYKKCGFMNELECDKITGLPLCGYQEIKEETELKEIITRVIYANEVAIFRIK